MHLTYANLFQIEDLLKCAIFKACQLPEPEQMCSPPEISSQQALFNDQTSSPTLLSQEATVVISNSRGPTRLWRGIPTFRSVLEPVSWEKGSHRSPGVACQGNERTAEACVSKAAASTLRGHPGGGRGSFLSSTRCIRAISGL